MKQTIEQALSITPENMASKQHDFLLQHTQGILTKLMEFLDNGNYDEAMEMFEVSPAGDGMGDENFYLKILDLENDREGQDLGAVVNQLSRLDKQAQRKKK